MFVPVELKKGEFYTTLLIDDKEIKSFSNRYDADKLTKLTGVNKAEVTKPGFAKIGDVEYQFGKIKSSVKGVVDNRHRNWRKRQ